MIMARRKNDQMTSSNLVVNQGAAAHSMTTMGNAPHPDSGRQKGLSPKTSKDSKGKFSSKSNTGALSSQITGLPFNLQ